MVGPCWILELHELHCWFFMVFHSEILAVFLRHQTSKSSKWMANRKQIPEMTSAIAQIWIAVDG